MRASRGAVLGSWGQATLLAPSPRRVRRVARTQSRQAVEGRAGSGLSGRRRAARRLRLEGEVEVAYKQRLEQLCYNERLAQQKLYRWGQAQRARAMELPNCAELNTRFGHRMPFYSY
jgi:hypothetical protein